MGFKKSPFLIRKLTKHLKISYKMISSSSEQILLTKEIGDKAVLTINRPKSLNAINVSLQRVLYKSLLKFEKEKTLIILKGAGDKAFSAGGDLLSFKETVNKENWRSMTSVYDLNALLYLIHTYKIPIVAVMNGIAYGGGAGLFYFSRYRIATEKALFAMPESKIAFHPNSGGTYFLNRAKKNLGYYLGLSGNTLKGSDVVQAGFATHYCLSSNLEHLEDAIINCKNTDGIKDILDKICEKNIPEFTLTPVIDKIDKYFSEPTIEQIFSKLDEDGSDWAKRTLQDLKKYSPSSLKVILRQLQKGRHFDVVDSLIMEGSLTPIFFKFSDVLEGIRVTLVNRGDVPKWNPSTLEEVTEEIVEKYFEPIDEEKQRQMLKDIRNRLSSKY